MAREITDTYKRDYTRGWRARGENSMENADARGETNAWYDGYADSSAGRDKWHLAHCKAHHNEPGGCGEA